MPIRAAPTLLPFPAPGSGPHLPLLTTWDFTARLATIRTPTLLLGAQYDFIPPSAYDYMHQQLPHSQVYICPNGSHFAMWDDPQHYFPALLKFLKEKD